ELTRNSKPVKMSDFSGEVGFSTLADWKNDLQAVASKQFPVVAQAIQWLTQYGSAKMTGSGACVFCAFESESIADHVLQQVPPHWKAWKAQALPQHPLAHLLKE
ncbi:MAG: 4-(cytidine 5'-diphospho)-2-C-methyl-D-erythritol kinase, partial [Herbaspirillum sp.]